MSKGTLAILGGEPVRRQPFPEYRTIGEDEKQAVMRVLDGGVLSKFLATWSDDFYGGGRVRDLERAWAEYFGVKYAVTVNSATSGLYAAVGASQVGPGDEVIVSPYTMSASAVGPLVYGATPVFADIDPRTYCISPATIRRVLSPRTKAIVAVDIFGHPADFDGIMEIARERNLIVIEDAAQAPGARYKGRYAGTLAHMGVFSLNYHKTIHCGEGGVIVTDDDELADRLRLIRNHGEAVVKAKGRSDLKNLIGFNYRMTEVEAAIAGEQLKKLESLLKPRIENAEYLSEHLREIPGLTPAEVQPDCRHGYYVLAVQYDADKIGLPRTVFVRALKEEGIAFAEGYVEPLYLEPIYQALSVNPRVCRGQGDDRAVSYAKGICPAAEEMHFEKLIYTVLIHAGMRRADLDDIVTAIEKVAGNASLIVKNPAVK